MSNFDKHVFAFSPTHIRFGPIQQFKDYRVLEKKSISDTLLGENDESLVFVTIWDCRTHVPMTSSVEWTDLDLKIYEALIIHIGIIRLYADDTILFNIVEDPLITGTTLNIDLSTIFSWAKQWLVDFNPIKQESFIISKKCVKPIHPPLYMGNTMITEVDMHKHLGIIFTNDMSWNNETWQ